MNKVFVGIIFTTLVSSCFNNEKPKQKFEEKAFYTAYEGEKYIFAVEAEALDENTYFSIYTKQKEKLFEKRIYVAPLIDSVKNQYIYLLKKLPVPEIDKKPADYICKIDTADLGFKDYKLITKYTCANNAGREEIKKWKFVKRENSNAVFFDIEKKENISVPTSRIVSLFQTLRVWNAEGYSDVSYSKDTSDADKYFDTFFRNN